MLPATATQATHCRLPARHILLSALALITGLAVAQKTHQRAAPRSSIRIAHLVPFPFIAKQIHFPVSQLDLHVFNPMYCTATELPKGFGHKVKVPQQVVQFEFGYKKGGIATIYESPAYGPGNALQFFKDVSASHAFRDREGMPGFTTAVIPNPKVFIVVCSVDKPVLAEATRELKRK
ncbi:MAG: hypothetical protein ACYC96_02865 [Fimbriimonadaceae bacterium]